MAANLTLGALHPARLIGSYTLETQPNRYWQHENHPIRLVIGNRPPHPSKPPSYLLYIDETNERHYISSLYPQADNTLKFVFKKIRFNLYQHTTFAGSFQNYPRITIGSSSQLLQQSIKRRQL